MCAKIILLCCILFIAKNSAEDGQTHNGVTPSTTRPETIVGEDCVPNNDVADGVCTLITDCEVALSAIRQKNFHTFYRCGFHDVTEVICCPRTTTKFGPDNKATERKADRECQKIIESSIPPLDLHIIGGEIAALGEFPHMVGIGYDRGDGYQFDCGGALVSRSFVLTAAHCIYNLERIEPTMIRAGVVELGDNKWHAATDYKISQVIAHPDYQRSTKYHDLALIRLETPVKLSSNLNAACLYTSDSDPDVPLTITGWGRTSTTQNIKSNVLLKTKVNSVPVSQCTPIYANWRKLPNGIQSSQICAGDSNGGHDACQGDSGGPLQITTSQDTQYRLVGVTSFGSGCGTTKPGVYTRVSYYLDWIENVVWPN